ncbi:glycoside hydrolase family 104 protein (plasmid) [Pantoea agglomerans]|uniref:glycoside hydrolase family 24 protein n=1 Tax=Enterobacter agglomerans TaxID=549 RepID=UPI002D780BCD|nr:glycoside hydrolase family 104 protein [Pantoea agglomerans]WRO92834.1 glycoside hydrolase family 104 protein [Pantoea agglomerans]
MEQSANRKAFGDMLAFSEGTSTHPLTCMRGYDVIVTGLGEKQGEIFTDFSDHPFANRRPKALNSNGLASTAAGRYQQLYRYWPAYKNQLCLPDFSPASQERLLDQLLKEQGAYADVQAGRIRTAIGKTNDIWASLTGSPYGQKTHPIETLLTAYKNAGGTITD